MTNFTVESILEEFQAKGPQKQGIRCSIKEILGLPYPLVQTCANLLRELLSALQQETEGESKYSIRPGETDETPQREGESLDFQRGSGEMEAD